MKNYFMAGLDLDGRPCLVVGGGEEATEKVERLLDTGAFVTVMSPAVTPELDQLAEAGRYTLRRRTVAVDDAAATVAGFHFVINTVKTNPALADALYRACEAGRILISGYDQPLVSNVVMPALVRSGRLRVGIATGASAPALARRLRENLETIFDEDFAEFVEELAAARRMLAPARISAAERRATLIGLVQGLRLEGRIVYPDWFQPGSRPAMQETPEPAFPTPAGASSSPNHRAKSAFTGEA